MPSAVRRRTSRPSTPLLDKRFDEGLRSVAVATLSAQLRARGLPHMSIDGVRPTLPDRTMVGVTHTLRYLPLREDLFKKYGNGMNAQKRAIEELRPGHVLVMDARRETSAGTLGDILVLRAQSRMPTWSANSISPAHRRVDQQTRRNDTQRDLSVESINP